MTAWIKKTTGSTQSSWGKASKIWIKTTPGSTQSSWSQVMTGWIKTTTGNTQSAWRKFFSNTANLVSISVADYATTNVGQTALLGTTLTANTSFTGTFTYTYAWFANGVSTGITTKTFVTSGYDGKNITVQVTATNGSGSKNATSSAVQVTKNKPVNTFVSFSNSGPSVGDTLSINSNWTATTKFTNDTLPDYYIATFITNSGTINYDSRNTSTWNQYTVLSTDVNHVISAYVTAYNTGAPLGVATSTVTTSTILINPGPFNYSIIDTTANNGPFTPTLNGSVSNNTLYLSWSASGADQYREYLGPGPITYTGFYPANSTFGSTSNFWPFTSSGTETVTLYAYNTLNGQVAVTYGGSTNADYYEIYYRIGTGAFTLVSNLTSGNIYFINAPVGTPVYVLRVTAYKNGGGFTNGTTSSTNPFTPTTKLSSVTSNFSLNYVSPTWTITWNANGGSVSPTSSVVNQGSSVTAPTPTWTNYTFKGWYDSASGGKQVVAGGQSYTPTSNQTLYAQWTYSPPAPSVISYASLSGSGVAGTSLTANAGSYNYGTVIATLITYAISPSIYSMGISTQAPAFSHNSPYTVTTTDASSPAFNFWAVDNIAGFNGTTYYGYSAPTLSSLPATPPASTPPASTPPAATPPASTPPTPPVSTPPASTPPASTPPASTPPTPPVSSNPITPGGAR